MNAQITPFRLEKSRHAAPQVFEYLREQIMSLALEPGTELSRAELVDQFGVSQTPIRDALMRLAEEGLVDIFPQHATVVCPINIALARQAHFLRRSVELEVVHTLASLADDTRAALVPNLILQPLVENALEHGVSKAAGIGRIELRARRDADRLVITLTDNGPGQTGTNAINSDGIGLTNTNARLRELYGPMYRVQLRAAVNGGTEAEMTLPFHTGVVNG
jgi:signal transduction histidine kinase